MHTDYGRFKLFFKEDGSAVDPNEPQEGEERKIVFTSIWEYEKHGWTMWSVWTFGGLLIFWAKRYGKAYWTVTSWVHYIVGGYMIFATTGSMIFLLKEFKAGKGFHSISGFIMTAIVLMLGLNGIASAITQHWF